MFSNLHLEVNLYTNHNCVTTGASRQKQNRSQVRSSSLAVKRHGSLSQLVQPVATCKAGVAGSHGKDRNELLTE